MKTCKVGCGKMKSGGTIKKLKRMDAGGMTNTSKMLNDIITRNGVANSGTTGPYSMKVGGSIKKFAALAPPYDKATAADRIAGAKKNARAKKNASKKK